MSKLPKYRGLLRCLIGCIRLSKFPILSTSNLQLLTSAFDLVLLLLLAPRLLFFQMNASDVRLQLIRAVAIVAVPEDRAYPLFYFAAFGDLRCVQKRFHLYRK
jgi:hypothetical protein